MSTDFETISFPCVRSYTDFCIILMSMILFKLYFPLKIIWEYSMRIVALFNKLIVTENGQQ